MIKKPKQVKFTNRHNPHAGFDLLQLEELYQRTFTDHSPFDHHRVNFYMIILITEGEGAHEIDLVEYSFKKGTLLTIRKDQIHKFKISKNAKGSILLFTDEFLVSYLEKLEALKSLQLFNEILGAPKIELSNEEMKDISELIQRIYQEYFKHTDPYSLSIIRSELQILIAKLYRIKSQKGQVINNRKYLSAFIIFQNLVEEHVTRSTKVMEYAKMIGVSTKTLNTITKSIVNQSAKEFIDDICTKQVKRLLINSELSIKEIASASGFEETTNFYKYFKRHTQLTPEGFRASLR